MPIVVFFYFFLQNKIDGRMNDAGEKLHVTLYWKEEKV